VSASLGAALVIALVIALVAGFVFALAVVGVAENIEAGAGNAGARCPHRSAIVPMASKASAPAAPPRPGLALLERQHVLHRLFLRLGGDDLFAPAASAPSSRRTLSACATRSVSLTFSPFRSSAHFIFSPASSSAGSASMPRSSSGRSI